MVLLGSADPLLHGKATINRRAPFFLASCRVSEEYILYTAEGLTHEEVASLSSQLVVTITITWGPGAFPTAEQCGEAG